MEDEGDVRDFMLLHLKREGYEAVGVESGEEGLQAATQQKFDLAILDWMLPGISGLEVCRKLAGPTPVLMVTARADSSDIVAGLGAGADDYIIKPFEIPVFLARVRALLRRGGAQAPIATESSRLSIGALSLDIEQYKVNCGDEKIELTPSEFRLLTALMRNQGRVLSRDRLVELVQGEDVSVGERTIDTHVFGLRKKLSGCADVIETIRGVGYRVHGTPQ